ncbi:glycoside hydrolase family 31 protein [Ferruginibacter sp.]
MAYKFVNVNEFTPNAGQWTPVGNISGYTQSGNVFTLQLENDPALKLIVSVLSAVSFRIRFNPAPNFNYAVETSVAVINRNLGQVVIDTSGSTPDMLEIKTPQLRICIFLKPYQVKVYRGSQLISQDMPSYNMVYIPGQEVVANFKAYPANARYCGFGEKAGSSLLKNNYTMTFFNFDNYIYGSGIIPSGTQGGPLNPAEPLYVSIPLLLEINPQPLDEYIGPSYAYGIFFDNPSQSYFNIGASDYSNMFGKYYYGALYGDMDYYFFYGDDAAGVLQQYTTLTGTAPMPPRYILGYHQGGYGYYNSTILSAVATAYRNAKIPIDGLHIDVDFQNNYRTFTSSNIKFPNVAQLMNGLHVAGFKCSTNITPLMNDYPLDETGNPVPYTQREAMLSINGLIFNTRAGQAPDPALYEGTVSYGVNPGTNPFPVFPSHPNNDGLVPLGAAGNYPDFSRKEVREKWGEQYQHLINEVGMDMIWQDMTDPAILNKPQNTFPLDLQEDNGQGNFVPHAKIHNAYALNLLNATNGGLKKLRPNKRPFIIARGGYAGMQRYAALWTGDSASSWDFLRINIPEVLNIGLSGVPLSGCDIGGFAVSSDPAGTTTDFFAQNGKIVGGITNYELLTRWVQLGAFLPWFRNHYNGYNKQFQEIYAYGEPVPTNCRKYIELRYRLLQLFYDALYEWKLSGMPVARALFLNDGHDQGVYGHLDDQFFVGKDLLVAPVLTQHESLAAPTVPLRDVYLPSGSNWYSFMDNKYPLESSVPGGTLVTGYFAGLDRVPLYVREGAIIPTRELEQYVGELKVNPLTINIYPGKDSSYKLYLDDGISTEAELENKYRYVQIDQQQSANTRRATFTRLTDNYTPDENYYFIAFLGTEAPKQVSIDGNNIPNVFFPAALQQSQQNSYYWNSNIGITFVKLFDNAAVLRVEADF